jgi:hypothetical protein
MRKSRKGRGEEGSIAREASGNFLLSEKCLERFNRRCGVSKQTLPVL